MAELNAVQLRVLGSLMEKRETTPDQYPLSLNALRNACNQKTARDPVTAYTEGEVGRALRELEALGFVREVWGARVPRYEHLAGKALGQTGKALAVLCPLMLRGPQTAGELRQNAHRLYEFEDIDDVQYMLGRLAEADPPLVVQLPRQPGQKEQRYGQLLAGAPQITAPPREAESAPSDRLEARVRDLEARVRDLAERLEAIEAGLEWEDEEPA